MRIAASTYLNSAPLVYSFAQGRLRDRYIFLGDTAPSRCAQLLAAGEAEVALIPVIEYQRIAGLRLLPDIAVAAKRQVRSVLLAARKPLTEVQTVALDPASRTSQTLVKIVLKRHYFCQPQYVERAPHEELLADADAALVIGDPALRLLAAPPAGVALYDLAEVWRALTGLPFVFAVWAVREDGLDGQPDLLQDFLAAKAEGLTQLDALAAQSARALQLPVAALRTYLREHVNFDLDEENRAGLERYFQLAYEDGWLTELRPLRWLTGQ